jgi:WD40 repeat protein
MLPLSHSLALSLTSLTQEPIVDLRFSPDGHTLIAACHSGLILAYSITDPRTGVWSQNGSIAAPLSQDTPHKIDFSTDNRYIRCSYLTAKDYRIFNINNQNNAAFGNELTAIVHEPINPDAPNPALIEIKSLKWASNRCPYAWDTKGMHSVTTLSSDLVLSNASFDRFEHLFLCGLGSGKVCVERAPAPFNLATDLTTELSPIAIATAGSTAGYSSFSAHLGGVSALLFIDNGSKLVTAGAIDGTIVVWNVIRDGDEFEPDEVEEGEEAEAGDAIAGNVGGGDDGGDGDSDEEGGEDGPVELPAIYDR